MQGFLKMPPPHPPASVCACNFLPRPRAHRPFLLTPKQNPPFSLKALPLSGCPDLRNHTVHSCPLADPWKSPSSPPSSSPWPAGHPKSCPLFLAWHLYWLALSLLRLHSPSSLKLFCNHWSTHTLSSHLAEMPLVFWEHPPHWSTPHPPLDQIRHHFIHSKISRQ